MASTSAILHIVIRDNTVGTGAGKTGLAHNTGSLTAYYFANTDTQSRAITLVDMSLGTFTSSGFKEIDATNMPGHYSFCPPNAAAAVAGATSVAFCLRGATGMAQVDFTVPVSDGEFMWDKLSSVDDNVAVAQVSLDDLDSRTPDALTGDGNMKADALKINGATPNNISAAQVNAECDQALLDYDGPTESEMDNAFTALLSSLTTVQTNILAKLPAALVGGRMDCSVGAMVTDAITAAALSAAAVTKIEAALLNEGDGQALIDAIVQAIDAADIDTDILPALIRDAILDRVLSGNHDTAGSVGKVLQDALANTTAIEADTQDLQSRTPNALTANGNMKADALRVNGTAQTAGDLAALITTIDGVVDSIATAISTLNDLSQAEAQTAATAALNAYDGPTHAETTTATQQAKLASDGLDAIATTDPSGSPASFNFRQMLISSILATAIGEVEVDASNSKAIIKTRGGTPIAERAITTAGTVTAHTMGGATAP